MLVDSNVLWMFVLRGEWLLTNQLSSDILNLDTVLSLVKMDILPKQLKNIVFGTVSNVFVCGNERYTGRHVNTVCGPILIPFRHKYIAVGIVPNGIAVLDLGMYFDQDSSIYMNRYAITPNNTRRSSKLERLIFGAVFNQPILPGMLPPNLTDLTFGRDFNFPIGIDVLPTHLKRLTFGVYFDSDVIFPPELEYLTFGSRFNQPIRKLPLTLKHLVFGIQFDQYIVVGMLPTCLLLLTFGNMFNKPISPGVLPDNLQILIFGNTFNQQLKSLPSCLKQLTFGSDFDQQLVVGLLPFGLEQLTLGTGFAWPLLAGTFPSTLQHLIRYRAPFCRI